MVSWADHLGAKTCLKNDFTSYLPDSGKDVKMDTFTPMAAKSWTGLELDEHLNIGPGIRYIYA
jgi:hypothetical protein